MPATNAAIGQGSQFAIGDGVNGGSTSYTPVDEVLTIEMPELTRRLEEATHLESPNDIAEFIAGLLELGEVSITFNYVPAASDALFTAIQAKKGDFQVTYPNGVTFKFSGIVTAWKPGNADATKMIGSLKVKGSSLPVLA
jgi:hypothetical protein